MVDDEPFNLIVLENWMNASNIKYEMIIRTNRFTNSRCVFHGGGQVIETYPGVGLGVKRESLSANQKLNNCFSNSMLNWFRKHKLIFILGVIKNISDIFSFVLF